MAELVPSHSPVRHLRLFISVRVVILGEVIIIFRLAEEVVQIDIMLNEPYSAS